MPKAPENFFSKNKNVLIIAGLVVAVVAIYVTTFGFDFINLDDDLYVVDNPAIRGGLTFGAIKWALTSFYAANWHPLTWISHAFDISLFGLSAGGHHAVNVVFHAANSILLFVLVRTLTGRFWESAAVAAIFAVHPAHVESVAWIAERKDVLSTLFWLLSTFFYVRYCRNTKDRRLYYASLALFAVGLAAKPMLVTLPFTFLLLDYWPLGRIERLSIKELLPLVKEKLPFFALSAVSSVITIIAQSAGGAVQSTVTIPFADRIANAVVAYAKYVAMMFYPADLGVWYPFEANLGIAVIAVSTMLLIGVTVFAVMRRNEQRYFFVGWLWFIGTLVPVIGILQVGRQAMADRYTYVPYIGLSIAVVWLVSDIFKRFKVPRSAVTLACSIAFLALAIVSFRQVGFWKNAETIAVRTLAVTKNNYLIESNYCNYLVRQNRIAEAVTQCNAAIEHEPGLVEAYNNLGTALLKQNKFDEARTKFEKAIQLDPGYAMAYGNLAIVESNGGNIDEAAADLAKAVQNDRAGYFDAKRRADGFSAIALAAMKQKRYDVAADGYKRALEAEPQNADFQRNLALAYRLSGRPAEAIALLEEIIRKNPNSAEACNTLGTIYAEQNKRAEAIAQFQRALQINPNFAPAQTNLKRITGQGE